MSEGVNALRSPDRSFLIITHYQRLLNYIVPDTVHVMSGGRIVKTGGKALALELEATGYADYRNRGCLTWLTSPLAKTPAETALVQAFESAKTALPGEAERRVLRPSSNSPSAAFRTAGSKSQVHRPAGPSARGCAFRRCAFIDEAKAALACAKALAGIEALQVPFVNGHFVREAGIFAVCRRMSRSSCLPRLWPTAMTGWLS